MHARRILGLLLVAGPLTVMSAGCARKSPEAGPGPAASATSAVAADAIYSGGPVVTVNDAQPEAEAVAVKDGRIVAVGTAAELDKFKGPETRLVELGGHTLVPGFIDGHTTWVYSLAIGVGFRDLSSVS